MGEWGLCYFKNMLLRKTLISLGVILGLGLILLVPVEYDRILSVGTDVYEAHHALYGERTKSQVVTLNNRVVGVGALLVDYRRSLDLKPVEVTVDTINGNELAVGEIMLSEIKDDEFSWTKLSEDIEISEREVSISFKAPLATTSNAIGLRFDKQNSHLAIGVTERVLVFKRLSIWVQDNPEKAGRVTQVLLGGLLISILLGLAGIRRKILKLDIFVWLLIGLVVATVFLRIPTARQVESVFGGDAFNYLLQSRAWLEGGNPFAEEFRRKAPLLPLLLLPSWLKHVDPLMWGRVVSMVSAVCAVVLLPLLLVRLKIPRSLAIGAGLLLVVNRNFWWESVHGLANTLYAALVLGAAYAFVLHRQKFGRYMVGVLAGLVTLARWEGGAVGAILLPAIWFQHRLKFKTIIYTVWPALVLIAIPFVFWPLTGEVGMRTVEDIAGDNGLGLASSLGDFISNLKGFELFVGRSWLLVEIVGKQLQFLGIGFGLGILFGFLHRQKSVFGGYMVRFMPYTLLFLIMFPIISGSSGDYKLTVLFITTMTGVGLGASLILKPKLTAPIWLMLLGQVIVITTILPKSRYYLQLIPFLCVGLVFSIWVLSDWNRSRISRVGAILTVGMLCSFVYLDSSLAMSGAVSDYNEKSSNHTVVMRASKYLLDFEGKVAVVEESDLPARIYLTMERTVLFPIKMASNEEGVSDSEVSSWLHENDISFIIETTAQPAFGIIDRLPEGFEFIEKFGTRHDSTEVTVYRVK